MMPKYLPEFLWNQERVLNVKSISCYLIKSKIFVIKKIRWILNHDVFKKENTHPLAYIEWSAIFCKKRMSCAWFQNSTFLMKFEKYGSVDWFNRSAYQRKFFKGFPQFWSRIQICWLRNNSLLNKYKNKIVCILYWNYELVDLILLSKKWRAQIVLWRLTL